MTNEPELLYYDITLARREVFHSRGIVTIQAKSLDLAKTLAILQADEALWSCQELVSATPAYIVDITCEDVVGAEPEANIRDYPISHPKPFYNI